jgi:hypothetical protein
MYDVWRPFVALSCRSSRETARLSSLASAAVVCSRCGTRRSSRGASVGRALVRCEPDAWCSRSKFFLGPANFLESRSAPGLVRIYASVGGAGGRSQAASAQSGRRQRLQQPAVGRDDVGAPFHHKGALERSLQPGKGQRGKRSGRVRPLPPPSPPAHNAPDLAPSLQLALDGINTAFAHMC